jgi:hypothetical protein
LLSDMESSPASSVYCPRNRGCSSRWS